jgi:Domain of unknown function (DUF305)
MEECPKETTDALMKLGYGKTTPPANAMSASRVPPDLHDVRLILKEFSHSSVENDGVRKKIEVSAMKRAWFLALVILIPGAARPAPQQTPRLDRGNAAVSPEWHALQESMEKMHAAMMSAGSSADSDKDFVRLMLPHHQAALDMARTELMYGNDPQMRRLAQEIITDQQSEIELMQLWLKQREPQK